MRSICSKAGGTAEDFLSSRRCFGTFRGVIFLPVYHLALLGRLVCHPERSPFLDSASPPRRCFAVRFRFASLRMTKRGAAEILRSKIAKGGISTGRHATITAVFGITLSVTYGDTSFLLPLPHQVSHIQYAHLLRRRQCLPKANLQHSAMPNASDILFAPFISHCERSQTFP